MNKPVKNSGNELYNLEEVLPPFFSGVFSSFTQASSPDFYTVVSLVFMSRVSHDEPLIFLIISSSLLLVMLL